MFRGRARYVLSDSPICVSVWGMCVCMGYVCLYGVCVSVWSMCVSMEYVCLYGVCVSVCVFGVVLSHFKYSLMKSGL